MTQNKNVKIAVTGGIGSGKSAVCDILRGQNLTVFSCDEIYAELLSDCEFVERLEREFGGVTLEDGKLNRKKLSQIVFADKSKLKKLNAVTHPAIMQMVFERGHNLPLWFCEVPLLFENGFEELFDGVIVVLRKRDERIESVCRRDGIGAEQAALRMENQYGYDRADFSRYYAINNDGDLDALRAQTLKILEKIKKTL